MTLEGQLSSGRPALGERDPGGRRSRGGGQPNDEGLDVAALIVGIVALLSAWAAVLGGLNALAGIVLGVLAVRAARHRMRSLTGLVLSAVALVLNVIVTGVVVVAVHNGGGVAAFVDAYRASFLEELVRGAGPAEVVTVGLTTPCYSFAVPAAYVNNQSEGATASCWTTRQLWGEFNSDGTVTNTGVGAIHATVGVEPIAAEQAAEINPAGTVNGMVDYLDSAYIPAMGAPIGDGEIVSVDGTLGNLTRVVSTVPSTKTKALLVLRAPTAYRVDNTEVRFFLVTFATVEENGDAIIDAAIRSWRWN